MNNLVKNFTLNINYVYEFFTSIHHYNTNNIKK